MAPSKKAQGRKARAAPPEPIRLKCARCGEAFDYLPKGGRRPKYCEKHRRGKAQERGEVAAQIRRERENRETREAAKLAAGAAAVSRLAAGLRVYNDPEQAAQLFGVLQRGDELAALVELARATHPKVINGDLSQTARLAQATVHALLTDLLERRTELPARDLGAALKVAANLAAELAPEGPQHNYTALVAFLEPPPKDGKLTPEQLAKMRGEEPASG